MDLGPEQPVTDDDAELHGGAVIEEQRVMPAGMIRRMAALLYDSLATVAVLMVATLPFLPFLHGRVLRPEEVGSLAYIYWAWEIIVVAGFFGFFWTRRGQTLGMQAWRLRVEDAQGRKLSWPLALLRQAHAVLPWLPGFLMLSYTDAYQRPDLQMAGDALLMIGLLSWMMMWFDARRRTWHDRMSNTRVVVLPKKGEAQSW